MAQQDITLDQVFLSTPSARRATPAVARMGRMGQYFYPRPLRGGRHTGGEFTYSNQKFLSTPSARRATCLSLIILYHTFYFYPRPLRGGRPTEPMTFEAVFYFYPRPLRGGRHQQPQQMGFATQFLSTPSARRATRCPASAATRSRYFYPRPLRGGRRAWAFRA